MKLIWCVVLCSVAMYVMAEPDLQSRTAYSQLVNGYPLPESVDGTSDLLRQLTQEENEVGPEEATGKAEAQASLKKPTKYHFFPHNQHVYLLPECATQQVCNAVYSRLNYSQPLCACPDKFSAPCSASTNSNDQHTLELGLGKGPKAVTLAKTCEGTSQIRACRTPQDWAILALQNTRTGKSQYLVICRCEGKAYLDGPMSHDQPAYAKVPGIRVYGMMCVTGTRRSIAQRRIRQRPGARERRSAQPSTPNIFPGFPAVPEEDFRKLLASTE